MTFEKEQAGDIEFIKKGWQGLYTLPNIYP
jgi:hypothetical protein